MIAAQNGDSVTVTFDVTVHYDSAILWIRDRGARFAPIDTIQATAPRRFRLAWADYFDASGGYYGVKIYCGTPSRTYFWNRRFVPQ